MKKFFAVAMTAALVLPAAATSAAAQDEKITIEGLVWLDRNGDKKFDGEAVLAGETKIVKISKHGGGDVVGEYATDDKGRYAARDLPTGKYDVQVSGARYTPTTSRTVTSEGGTVDFGVRGKGIAGHSFHDRNRDGVRQTGEELLSPGTLNGKPIGMPGEDGQFSVDDLPFGKYEFVAADYTQRGLALVKPTGTHPIDWATGTLEFTLGEFEGPAPLEVLYFEAKADIAVAAAVVPAKASYVLGEQIDVELTLTNKGDVPIVPSVVMAEFMAKLLSHSDNIKMLNGRDDDFETVSKILPGQQVKVTLKVELNDVTFDEVWPIARFNFGNLKDVDHKNNVVRLPIKVVEKSTTTEPSAPSSTSQTAAPATTTTPAVAKAGNNSGLASTGASPLGFLGLGALLLAAGAAAFFVARRRRS